MTHVAGPASPAGQQGRRLAQRVLPTQFSALAAIQAFLLIGAIIYVAWPPPNEDRTTFSVALIPVLLVLMTCTEVVARRLPWWGLETFLALTWLLVAGLATTRSNGQGQIFLAFAIMALVVYALYYLPRAHAVLQVVSMTIAYTVALFIKFGNLGPSLLMLAFLAMLAGTALLGAARANDRRERLLVEYAGDVVFHSADGIVQWISPSVRDVLGWDPDDLIGTNIQRLWHADDYDKAMAIRDLAYSGTSGVGLLRFLTLNGDYVWIEITFKPYSEHGEHGAVGTMRDVSDRVAAEQALMSSEQEYRQLAQMEAEQRKQLAELDNVKTQLFQNISHELRTPLTLIQAPLQELLNDDAEMSRMSARRRADLDAASRAASGLQRLVDVLLDVARGQAGELKYAPEPTNLAALTRDAVAMFRSRAEQSGLELIVTTVAFPPSVLIDRDAWLKILTNLVSNAMKFTARGQVSVDLRYSRGTVELLVADSGSGISEEDLPNIFTRFQQASSQASRGESGSGIGLALVAELVRAASGNIQVDSVVGLGTTFIVRIPAERSESQATEDNDATPAPRTSVAASSDGDVPSDDGSPRILLVEDHEDLRTYVARLLTSQGWHVSSVASADEAKDHVAGQDLVITDLMLPGSMDGVGLVRWLRANPGTSSTTAIVLTARTGVGTFMECLDAGADGFLTKPFDPDLLVARVRAHLELDQLARASDGDGSGELAAAVRGNRTVRTALAMLMAAEGMSIDDAFARLQDLRKPGATSVTDIAQDIVMSGRLASAR